MNNIAEVRREFQREDCGASSVFYGLKDVADGVVDTVTFVIADHPLYGFKVYERYTIGRSMVRGVLCWRWAGEGGKVDANGSHAVCASWDSQDLALACAIVASNLSASCERNKNEQGSNAWIFRQESR